MKEDIARGIMLKNIEKVATRGDKLEDLEEKAEALDMDASVFQTTATRLKRGGKRFRSRKYSSPPPSPPVLHVETAEVSDT